MNVRIFGLFTKFNKNLMWLNQITISPLILEWKNIGIISNMKQSRSYFCT